jgi:hypothetical protein
MASSNIHIKSFAAPTRTRVPRDAYVNRYAQHMFKSV